MKNAELGLVNHIKALQNSNAMCLNMNNSLAAQVELLIKDNNSLKLALATNTATAKNEKNDSEKIYTQSQAELKHALQRVNELENENNQLFCIIANERLQQKGPNQPNTQIEKEIEKERERLEQEKRQQEKSDKEKLEQERTKYKDELEQEREKHKQELDKESANHKKAMEHLKEQNKATVDALRSTNKKNYSREREIHEKQIERHRDLLKREIEKEKTQAHKLKAAQTQHKNAEQDMKRQIGHLQEQLSGLEEQKRQYFTVMNHVRTENAQLKKRLSERQGKNQDSLQLLSNSYNSFEQEKANLDALIRFMQSTRDNMHQSSLEMKNAIASAGAGHVVHVEVKKPVVVHHSVLTQSALHLREELERESEMRRKRRRDSGSIQDDQ
jgi:regulator of replication initiation timing